MVPSQLIADLSPELFGRILFACPRRARETLFTRFGVPKAKKKASSLLPAKDPARIAKLQAVMASSSPEDEEAQQFADELLRVYLMGRRALLGAALDAMGVEHEDGRTDADLDAFAELDEAAAAELADKLSADHDADDVSLYLRFMGAPVAQA